MKDLIKFLLLYAVLIGGLCLGNWYGCTELLRVSIWVTWALIVLSLIGISSPSSEFYKNNKRRGAWKRVFFASHLVLLVASGWLFTATPQCFIHYWEEKGNMSP